MGKQHGHKRNGNVIVLNITGYCSNSISTFIATQLSIKCSITHTHNTEQDHVNAYIVHARIQTYPKGREAHCNDDKSNGVHQEGGSIVVMSSQTDVLTDNLTIEELHINLHHIPIITILMSLL